MGQPKHAGGHGQILMLVRTYTLASKFCFRGDFSALWQRLGFLSAVRWDYEQVKVIGLLIYCQSRGGRPNNEDTPELFTSKTHPAEWFYRKNQIILDFCLLFALADTFLAVVDTCISSPLWDDFMHSVLWKASPHSGQTVPLKGEKLFYITHITHSVLFCQLSPCL